MRDALIVITLAILNIKRWGGSLTMLNHSLKMQWHILKVLYSEARELLKKAEDFKERIGEFADKRRPTGSEKASIAAKCFELRMIWNTWNRPDGNDLPHIHRDHILEQIHQVKTDLQFIWKIERHLGTNTSLEPEHIERLEDYLEDLIDDLENGWFNMH